MMRPRCGCGPFWKSEPRRPSRSRIGKKLRAQKRAGGTMATAAFDLAREATPLRAVRLGPADCVSEHRPDGTILMRSPHPLAPYPAKLTERLEHWAQVAPERIFLGQRHQGGHWRTLTYAQTLAHVCGLAQALLE